MRVSPNLVALSNSSAHLTKWRELSESSAKTISALSILECVHDNKDDGDDEGEGEDEPQRKKSKKSSSCNKLKSSSANLCPHCGTSYVYAPALEKHIRDGIHADR
jgi:hypothetical protein